MNGKSPVVAAALRALCEGTHAAPSSSPCAAKVSNYFMLTVSTPEFVDSNSEVDDVRNLFSETGNEIRALLPKPIYTIDIYTFHSGFNNCKSDIVSHGSFTNIDLHAHIGRSAMNPNCGQGPH